MKGNRKKEWIDIQDLPILYVYITPQIICIWYLITLARNNCLLISPYSSSSSSFFFFSLSKSVCTCVVLSWYCNSHFCLQELSYMYHILYYTILYYTIHCYKYSSLYASHNEVYKYEQHTTPLKCYVDRLSLLFLFGANQKRPPKIESGLGPF